MVYKLLWTGGRARKQYEVQEYKEELKKQAEQLVLKGFPETIVRLNQILETSQFKNRRFSDVHQDLNIPIPDPIVLNSHTDLPAAKKTKLDERISDVGTKVMILPTGSVPTNKHLVDLVEQVKPHIRRLVEDSNLSQAAVAVATIEVENENSEILNISEPLSFRIETLPVVLLSYTDLDQLEMPSPAQLTET
nr:unnamed protein product [Callosobruchus analis]